ncbi:hypothetical protein D3C72_872580 [compost metagenome]
MRRHILLAWRHQGADLLRVPEELAQVTLRPVARGVDRHVDDHHVGRVVLRCVRQPVEEHVGLTRPGWAGEDHAGVVEAGEHLHGLDQVRREIVVPVSNVGAGVVQVADLFCGLGHRYAFRRFHPGCRSRDHLLQ